MSNCIDSRFEAMLHAYELGLLDLDEVRDIEMHLMDCASCRSQVEANLDIVRLLRHDPAVRPAPDEIRRLGLEPYVGAGLYGAKSPIKVNRLLLMAAVLVLVCVSVIKYGLMTESGPPATEVLELYPLRASEGRTVTLVAGGRIEIHFVVSGYHDGIVSNIRIESSDSSVVYERDVFADFNEMGLGVITLSADRFKVGLYRFIVTDTRTDAVKASYNFRVD